MGDTRKTVGIIGFGNMGQAIAERIKSKYKVLVFDADKNKTKNPRGINIADNSVDLVNKVEIIILAVKPQDFDVVLNEIKGHLNDQLIISIAAGITTRYIEKFLGAQRVIRVMPNLPAKVEKGMSCLCKDRFASDEDLELAEEVFKRVGETLVINENMMDAATAVSGSGPGFFFSLVQGKTQKEIKKFATNVFLPILEQAAQDEGFDKNQAHILSATTTAGSLALLAVPGNSAEMLRIKVVSPKGTTEAGLKVLQNNPENLPEAVKAAKKRAEELSKE
jgi:pyrroline-5-carboxylate reductase